MRGVEGLWDPERERREGGGCLIRWRGYSRRRERIRGITVKGGPRAFSSIFYDSSSLIVPFTVTSSIVCFLLLAFSTPSQGCVSLFN